MKKVVRAEAELINELKEQLDLLGDAVQKVNSGDFKYAKILSSILRILVIETSTNNSSPLSSLHTFKSGIFI